MSTYLISCGGTGGHLSPGIALAEGLSERGHRALLLISEKQVDTRLVGKYPGLEIVRIPGRGFTWHPMGMLRCLGSLLRGFLKCRQLIRRTRPDGIIGFGGFSSVPVAFAGWMQGVPVAIHEANRVPGLAVRTVGRFADRIYLPPAVRLGCVRQARVRHVGLPVRKEIRRQPIEAARESLGLDPERKVLVVFGGSQGAASLNSWVRGELRALSAKGIQVCCVTGLGKGESETVAAPGPDGSDVKSVFIPFCDRVADLLSAADLVVSRAGAGTIAELVRCSAPAVLVPYPHAADDHQRVNAAFFERQGGGIVVADHSLGELRAEVEHLISNEWLLRCFRANLQRMDRANSLDLMLRDLEGVVHFTETPPPMGAQATA
jgi:UDP-N-acetylglucosamine--N-acetylmuramyl-(pentapeptide) pyrophosphoryl-undecaprenol N-acetylglucosamine transferase